MVLLGEVCWKDRMGDGRVEVLSLIGILAPKKMFSPPPPANALPTPVRPTPPALFGNPPLLYFQMTPPKQKKKRKYIRNVPEASNSDGQHRQSPITSVQRTRSTLATHPAVSHGANATPMNAIQNAAQRTTLWMRIRFSCVH